MKRLFFGFLISQALDRRKPLSSFWRTRLSRSADLQQLHRSTEALDQLLRQKITPPSEPASPWLHQSVLRALSRDAESGGLPGTQPAWQLAVASIVGLLLIAGAWWFTHEAGPVRPAAMRYIGAPAMPSVAPAVELTRDLTTASSTEFTTPLYREIDCLQKRRSASCTIPARELANNIDRRPSALQAHPAFFAGHNTLTGWGLQHATQKLCNSCCTILHFTSTWAGIGQRLLDGYPILRQCEPEGALYACVILVWQACTR